MEYLKAIKAKKAIDTLCMVVDEVTQNNEIVKTNIGQRPFSNLLRMDFVKFLLSMSKEYDEISPDERCYLNAVFGVKNDTIEYLYNSEGFNWSLYVQEVPFTLQVITFVEKPFLIISSGLNKEVEPLQKQIKNTYKLLGYDYLMLESTNMDHKTYVYDLYMRNIAKWVNDNSND